MQPAQYAHVAYSVEPAHVLGATIPMISCRPTSWINETHLHEPTHDTIAHEQLIPSQGHGGDDGVIRAFPALGEE